MLYELVKATCEGSLKYQILNLSRCPQVDDNVCKFLKNVMSEKTSVETIILDESQLSNAGLTCLLAKAHKNTTLSTLSCN